MTLHAFDGLEDFTTFFAFVTSAFLEMRLRMFLERVALSEDLATDAS